MKRKMVPVLILALLNLWIPYASAEISQELDPMVSPDAQATVASESSATNGVGDQVSPGVTVADPATDEKKVEEAKKETSKKSLKKKSSEKKEKKEKKGKKEKKDKKKRKSSIKNTKKNKESFR